MRGINYYFLLFVFVAREVVKRLPGGRTSRSVRVSAQTEPWRPDSCTGKIYLFLLVVDDDHIL